MPVPSPCRLAAALLAVLVVLCGSATPVSATTTTAATATAMVRLETVAPAYFVDPVTGSDRHDGRSPEHAWRTLGRASRAVLAPGDVLRLRSGTTHVGALVLSERGTASRSITVEPYGAGAAPVVRDGSCVRLVGDWLAVTGIHAAGCERAGFHVEGTDVTLRGVEASGSVSGVWVRPGAVRATVADSWLHDNDRMAPGTPGHDDDYGAFGVEVNGDDTRVVRNRMSGHRAVSADYGHDGSAVEVFQARGTVIRDNTSTDDLAFTELGGSRSSGTRVAGNSVTSSVPRATFLMTRGAGQSWGPVIGTVARDNTVRLTGSSSFGFGCYGGCTPTNLVMRGNDIAAASSIGWVDGSITTTDNDYRGDLWFSLGAGDTWEARPGSRSVRQA